MLPATNVLLVAVAAHTPQHVKAGTTCCPDQVTEPQGFGRVYRALLKRYHAWRTQRAVQKIAAELDERLLLDVGLHKIDRKSLDLARQWSTRV